MKKRIIGASMLMMASALTFLTVFSPRTFADTTVDQPIIKKAINNDLNPKVAELAIKAFNKAEDEGISHSNILTVVDFSKPSNEKRMWIFDLKNQKLLFHNVVAHGSGSGDLYAKAFSNQDGTHESSLGLYLTKNTYTGHNGYSMRLEGLEKGFNDHALNRAIVVHGATYVSSSFAQKYGRIGRSWGCPAVPVSLAKPIISTIKGGSLMFVYANNSNYLHHSKFIS